MKTKTWFLMNGVFLAITLLAVFNISTPAVYVMYLIGWFTILTTWTLKSYTTKYANNPTLTLPVQLTHQSPSVPSWLNYSFDIAILGLLMFGGYYVFAIFYATHIPMIPSIFKDLDTLLSQGRIQAEGE